MGNVHPQRAPNSFEVLLEAMLNAYKRPVLALAHNDEQRQTVPFV
jgi:hypothetical protein|tara:strand:- start:43749 stop:43883 length:135 start_codon:yes stop_codon:yes gene_type:complete